MLTEALALWRGPALADVLYQPFAGARARQLEEQRLGALESRIEAELDCGGGAALVPELEQLVADHPLRERLVAALMLALYRAGRQADALAAFQAARGRLVEELGLEPGPEVRELQQRILQHDPALAAPRRSCSPPRGPAARAARLALLPRSLLGAVLTAGFCSAPRAAHAGARDARGRQRDRGREHRPRAGSWPRRRSPARPGRLGSGAGLGVGGRSRRRSGLADRARLRRGGGPDPGRRRAREHRQRRRRDLGGEHGRCHRHEDRPGHRRRDADDHAPGIQPGRDRRTAPGRLWVADSVARELFEIDPASGSLERTLPLDLQPSAIAVAGGAIWVAGYDDATVEKIDPASGRVIGRVHVGDGPAALAFDAGSLWVANSLDATVSRIDPATLTVDAPRSRSAAARPRWPPARDRCGSPISTPAPSPGSTRAATGWRPAWTSVAPRRRSRWAGAGCGWESRRTAAATAAGRW